jgi:hypothetical protein
MTNSDKQRDDVLKRMLNTPPKPKVSPAKSGKTKPKKVG